MKIVIVGDGKVGSTLAERLSNENHDVAVIDNNPDVIKTTSNNNDIIGIVGNGAVYTVQQEAGVEQADLLVAATSSDERNIMCAIIAKKLGAKSTIARVRTPEYYSQLDLLKEDLGLSLYINPEYTAAAEMSRIIRCPAAVKMNTIARGKAEMLTLTLPADNKLVGLSLSKIQSKYGSDFLICAIQRKDKIIVPDGNEVLEAGDRFSVVGSPIDVAALLAQVGLLKNRLKNVMIAGGGRIAYYLSKHLIKMGLKVKIVEKNINKCKKLCVDLPDAEILCGDANDHDFLLEEGLSSMDAFVSLTGMDEHNIMMSLYAKTHDIPRVITKVNSVDFHSLLGTLGLDTVVSPKLLTADSIVSYVRGLHNSEGSAMETMYNLFDGRLELLDFHITANPHFIDVPLKDLTLIRQTLIVCIVRDGKVIIPNGDTTIQTEDNVIFLTQSQNIDRIDDIIKK